jgi:Uma2 family endonuclease
MTDAPKQAVIEREREPETRTWPPPQGQWTYEDWLRLPDDNWQYEVIKGVMYMAPAPSTDHQDIATELGWHMLNFIKQGQLGKLYHAPVNVYLPGQETPVEPDLVFIAANRLEIISKRGIEGAPDLVVEILSPNSWWRDRRAKLPLYEETGVRECWLIDPELQTIEIYALRDQSYALLGQWGRGEVAASEVMAGFEIGIEVIMPVVKGMKND